MALVNTIKHNGGITLDMTGNPIQHKSGYYVSILELEKIPVKKLSSLKLKINLHLLKSLFQNIQSRYLGVWIDREICYIDISIHVRYKWYAMLLGRWYKQMSIWDCRNKMAREVKHYEVK